MFPKKKKMRCKPRKNKHYVIRTVNDADFIKQTKRKTLKSICSNGKMKSIVEVILLNVCMFVFYFNPIKEWTTYIAQFKYVEKKKSRISLWIELKELIETAKLCIAYFQAI